MTAIIGEVLEGIVTATTFSALSLIIPDKAVEEQKRYNDVMINLEKKRFEWDRKMDRLRNELEQAQREKNDAKQSEVETRIRLSRRPQLKYEGSQTFNSVHSTILLVLGISSGYVVSRII